MNGLMYGYAILKKSDNSIYNRPSKIHNRVANFLYDD